MSTVSGMTIRNRPFRAHYDVRTQVHPRDVLHRNRRAVGTRAEARLLDVTDAADVAAPAHHVRAAGPLHHAPADIVVARADRPRHRVDEHAVGEQRVGVDLDLVLLDIAAHRGDFRHAGDTSEPVLHVPAGEGPELRQIVSALRSTSAYSKPQPTPVASGPSAGWTPAGSRPCKPLRYSRTRLRAQYRSVPSWKIT
ncbi:MAG TPA: hypothetical protein VNK92_02175 [Vicinamibacterales bacterium]|nr:hypothetical protein [Vicinamibacterales bacterium]